MKIAKKSLKKIIIQEIEKILKENPKWSDWDPFDGEDPFESDGTSTAKKGIDNRKTSSAGGAKGGSTWDMGFENPKDHPRDILWSDSPEEIQRKREEIQRKAKALKEYGEKAQWETARRQAEIRSKATEIRKRSAGSLNSLEMAKKKDGSYVLSDEEVLRREAYRKAGVNPDKLGAKNSDWNPLNSEEAKRSIQRSIEAGEFSKNFELSDDDIETLEKDKADAKKGRTRKAVGKAAGAAAGAAGWVWRKVPMVGKVIIAWELSHYLWDAVAHAGTPKGDAAFNNLMSSAVEIIPLVGEIMMLAGHVYNKLSLDSERNLGGAIKDLVTGKEKSAKQKQAEEDRYWALKDKERAEKRQRQICRDPEKFCFVEGSLVKVPGGHKPIEQIKKNDEVIVFDPETGDIYPQKVKETTGLQPSKQHISLHLETGKIISCTRNHRMLTPQGFVKAGDLTLNSKLRHYENTSVSIINIEEHVEDSNVVTLDVGGYPRTFIVEDCVVHNAKIKIKILNERKEPELDPFTDMLDRDTEAPTEKFINQPQMEVDKSSEDVEKIVQKCLQMKFGLPGMGK